MNWSYLSIEALMPLAWSLGVTFLVGAIKAFHLHRRGGASRVAWGHFLKMLAMTFPLAFLVSALWESRQILRGFIGVVRHQPTDLRAMGLLRLNGDGFLRIDRPASVHWFRRAALCGDGMSQLHLARALASGRGVERNPTEALHWAEASAQQGSVEAALLSGDLWRPHNMEQTNRWYQRALEGLQPALHTREPKACMTFGLMTASGKGVQKDPVEGLAWMKAAEMRGLTGMQTLNIALTQAGLSPEQREKATLRAKDLVTPP